MEKLEITRCTHPKKKKEEEEKGVEQSKAVQKKMALYGNLGFQIIRKS